MATRNRVQLLNDLLVYKLAKEIAVSIYSLCLKLPKDEKFGLISQMQRCSISIMANIAESQGRRTLPDQRNFLVIARGSLCELVAYLDFCKVSLLRKYGEEIESLLSKLQDLEVRLVNFINTKGPRY